MLKGFYNLFEQTLLFEIIDLLKENEIEVVARTIFLDTDNLAKSGMRFCLSFVRHYVKKMVIGRCYNFADEELKRYRVGEAMKSFSPEALCERESLGLGDGFVHDIARRMWKKFECTELLGKFEENEND